MAKYLTEKLGSCHGGRAQEGKELVDHTLLRVKPCGGISLFLSILFSQPFGFSVETEA